MDKPSSNRFKPVWAALLLAGAACALTACDNAGNKTAGQQLDSAVAKTEKAVDTATSKTEAYLKEQKAKADANGTTARIESGMSNAKDAIKDATSNVSAKVDDASITASVSAGLAKDPDLSAIKINVDTKAGAVSLRGPAPNAEAKARAEQIAKGVQGVTSVDNQLEVKI